MGAGAVGSSRLIGGRPGGGAGRAAADGAGVFALRRASTCSRASFVDGALGIILAGSTGGVAAATLARRRASTASLDSSVEGAFGIISAGGGSCGCTGGGGGTGAALVGSVMGPTVCGAGAEGVLLGSGVLLPVSFATSLAYVRNCGVLPCVSGSSIPVTQYNRRTRALGARSDFLRGNT